MDIRRLGPRGGSLLVLALLSACTHQIRPAPAVPAPPAEGIDAAVVLILTEELEAYESTQTNGAHTFFFHFGKATADGVEAVFRNVFSGVDVRRQVGQGAAMALVANAESLDATYLAIPRVQAKGSTGALDTDVELEVVLDVIDLASGESTLIRGSAKEGFTVSATGSAETALENVLGEIQAELIAFHGRER